MPRFEVDVKCFFNVTLDAANEDEAREKAEAFVNWTDPTQEFIDDYNDNHDTFIVSGMIGIDGTSTVERDDSDEICGTCHDPRCDGCSPADTPSLDTSFHDHEMDV